MYSRLIAQESEFQNMNVMWTLGSLLTTFLKSFEKILKSYIYPTVFYRKDSSPYYSSLLYTDLLVSFVKDQKLLFKGSLTCDFKKKNDYTPVLTKFLHPRTR